MEPFTNCKYIQALQALYKEGASNVSLQNDSFFYLYNNKFLFIFFRSCCSDIFLLKRKNKINIFDTIPLKYTRSFTGSVKEVSNQLSLGTQSYALLERERRYCSFSYIRENVDSNLFFLTHENVPRIFWLSRMSKRRQHFVKI